MYHLISAPKNNGYTSEIQKTTRNTEEKAEEYYNRHEMNKETFGTLECSVRIIFRLTMTIKHSLKSAKDTRDPCSRGQVYIGTPKRSINTNLMEHKSYFGYRYG